MENGVTTVLWKRRWGPGKERRIRIDCYSIVLATFGGSISDMNRQKWLRHVS